MCDWTILPLPPLLLPRELRKYLSGRRRSSNTCTRRLLRAAVRPARPSSAASNARRPRAVPGPSKSTRTRGRRTGTDRRRSAARPSYSQPARPRTSLSRPDPATRIYRPGPNHTGVPPTLIPHDHPAGCSGVHAYGQGRRVDTGREGKCLGPRALMILKRPRSFTMRRITTIINYKSIII